MDGNTAPNAGGGGIQNLLGTAILNSSQVDGNTSLNGGGISSGNGNGGVPPGTSQLALNKSEVDGNTAIAPIPPPPAPGQMSGPPIAAGGIANGGNAVLSNSEVDHNTAKFTSGAGIVNHGTMTLNKSEVTATPLPVAAWTPPAGEYSPPRACPQQYRPPSPSITAR